MFAEKTIVASTSTIGTTPDFTRQTSEQSTSMVTINITTSMTNTSAATKPANRITSHGWYSTTSERTYADGPSTSGSSLTSNATTTTTGVTTNSQATNSSPNISTSNVITVITTDAVNTTRSSDLNNGTSRGMPDVTSHHQSESNTSASLDTHSLLQYSTTSTGVHLSVNDSTQNNSVATYLKTTALASTNEAGKTWECTAIS